MPNKRLYNDKEISAVLKRAAELQRDQGPADPSGLSLDELEQIAAEVGIDPDFIKTAATELDEGRAETPFHLWGGPTSVELERIVEGELSEARWEEAVAEIRRIYGVAGETGQIGRTLEWVLRDQTGDRSHVTLTPMGGQTRIRLYTRLGDWAMAFHAPLISTSIVPAILVVALSELGPALETGLFVFIIAAAFMLARLAYGLFARRQERKARRLLTRLEDLIAGPDPPLAEPVAATVIAETDRIDPSLLTDEETPDRVPPEHRRVRE